MLSSGKEKSPLLRRVAIEQHGVVVDGRHKLVIPGLINAHYHSHDVLSRGMFEAYRSKCGLPWRSCRRRCWLTACEVELRTLPSAPSTASQRHHHRPGHAWLRPEPREHVEAAIKAYDDVGIRCVLQAFRSATGRRSIVCRASAQGCQTISLHSCPAIRQRCATSWILSHPLAAKVSDRLSFAVAPGSPQRCTFELMSGLADLASRHNLPFVTRVNESKLQVYLAQELYADYGGSPLDFLKAAGALDERLCAARTVSGVQR